MLSHAVRLPWPAIGCLLRVAHSQEVVHSVVAVLLWSLVWSLGRLRVYALALVCSVLCVHREGVPVDVWCVR